MKVPVILLACLVLTDFVDPSPSPESETSWEPWIYVETQGGVELYWRRQPDPIAPKIQFGFRNRTDHAVSIQFVELAYDHADGRRDLRPPLTVRVPAQSSQAAEADVLTRLPRSWSLDWDVSRIR